MFHRWHLSKKWRGLDHSLRLTTKSNVSLGEMCARSGKKELRRAAIVWRPCTIAIARTVPLLVGPFLLSTSGLAQSPPKKLGRD